MHLGFIGAHLYDEWFDCEEGELESEEGSGTVSQRIPIEEARAMSHKE